MTDPDTTAEPEPLTEQERELVRGVLADYYDGFTKRRRRNRPNSRGFSSSEGQS